MNVMDDAGMDPTAPSVVVPSGTCDHCGPAVAAHYFAFVKGVELAYCGHCATRYEARLSAVATTVIDMRDRILETA